MSYGNFRLGLRLPVKKTRPVAQGGSVAATSRGILETMGTGLPGQPQQLLAQAREVGAVQSADHVGVPSGGSAPRPGRLRPRVRVRDAGYRDFWWIRKRDVAAHGLRSLPSPGVPRGVPVKQPSRKQVTVRQGLTGFFRFACGFQSRNCSRGSWPWTTISPSATSPGRVSAPASLCTARAWPPQRKERLRGRAPAGDRWRLGCPRRLAHRRQVQRRAHPSPSPRRRLGYRRWSTPRERRGMRSHSCRPSSPKGLDPPPAELGPAA